MTKSDCHCNISDRHTKSYKLLTSLLSPQALTSTAPPGMRISSSTTTAFHNKPYNLTGTPSLQNNKVKPFICMQKLPPIAIIYASAASVIRHTCTVVDAPKLPSITGGIGAV